MSIIRLNRKYRSLEIFTGTKAKNYLIRLEKQVREQNQTSMTITKPNSPLLREKEVARR